MFSSRLSLLRILASKKEDDDDDDDEGDLNEFNPRRNKTERGLTPAQVKAKLLAVGVVFMVTPDEYTVRLKKQKKDEAYTTDDLDDALDTGLKMAE